MKALSALLLILNFIGFNLFAKRLHPATDSLKKLINLNSDVHDTLTIHRIDKLADGYFESFPDSTAYYGNLEIELSTKMNYAQGIANGHTQLANVNTFRGDYTTAVKNFNTALNIYKQINDDHGISESYMGLGRIQDYLGNYDSAIRLFNTALQLSLSKNMDRDAAECYNVTGITYDNRGDFAKALDCYFKALVINIKYNDELDAADNYCNIGVIMQHLELYPKALNYFDRALGIWQRMNDGQGISTASQNIGEVLMAQKQYAQAIVYLNKAAEIFKKMDDREGRSLIDYDLGLYNYYTSHTDAAISFLNLSLQSATVNKIKYNKAYAYQGLALVYNLEKDYPKAYDYAVKAEAIAEKLGSVNALADAALQESKALAGLKHFEQAYRQHELYTSLKDSLNSNDQLHKIMTYNLEIDFLKKENENAYQQHLKDDLYQQKITRQKISQFVYAALIVVMAALALTYYYRKRKQEKINAILAEKNREIILQKENLDIQSTKLNELNLLKDRLIAVLAHDLRAPISTLRGLFNLMTDDSISRQEFVTMLPIVFNKLEYTSDFLDTLLFWINSQVDGEQSNVQAFNMNDLIMRELTYLDSQLKYKDITTSCTLAPDAIALADPNSIRIVIHNILTNAIKFCNRGGRLQITCFVKNSECLVFSLKDNGVGMTADYMQSIFKTQVQSKTGTENETGTGMGLLFCKDLVEKNKGKIWVESSLGVGTELGFELPVA